MEADKIVPFDTEEITDFERDMVDKAVRAEIALQFGTRVEIRDALGIWARAFQKCVAITHDVKDERQMRNLVSYELREAQQKAIIYRRKAAQRQRRQAEKPPARPRGAAEAPRQDGPCRRR